MIDRPRQAALTLLFAAALLLSCTATYAQSAAEVEYVDPDPATGSSRAVVVGEVPLAHTTQLLPFTPSGQLARGGTGEQISRVLQNLRLTLAEVGADFDDLVKINVYTTGDEVVRRVKERFAETFAGEVKPAVSFMVGQQPRAGVQVAMDAVARAPASAGRENVLRVHSEAVYAESGRGHLAIVSSPRGQVYVSGQAAREDNLVGATRGTMQSLHATLAYLGLSAEDVVQVKAFINPMADAEEVEQVIAEYYRTEPAPPIVVVEWLHSSLHAEIELIANRDESESEVSAGDDLITYVTPPGMSAASTFSRVAEVHGTGLAYISGLYGDPSEDAEGQVRGIFAEMEELLPRVGSDFDHLVKATYYPTEGEASSQLGEVRPEYYDPERPPTASLIAVEGTGQEGSIITLDMIAVPVE